MSTVPEPPHVSLPADAANPAPLADSGEARSRAARVTDAFGRLHVRARARVLGRMLAAVGSLALAVVGGGVFAKYITQVGLPRFAVSFDDAARATWTQVYDLVRYVQQSNPDLFDRLLDELARLRSASPGPALA